MAVLSKIPGLDVEIIVAGNALHEYLDPDLNDNERTVTRYVEAVSNQTFDIKATCSPSFKFKSDCVLCEIYIDGDYCENIDVSPDHEVATSKGIAVSKGKFRDYCFSGLDTATSGVNTQINENNRPSHIGTIKIECSFQNLTRKTCPSRWPTSNCKKDGIGQVAEKALKGRAISHSTRFNEVVNKPDNSHRDIVIPAKGFPDPIATVVFHYRSMDALKALRIVPRTPTPPPIEERDVESLSRDELKQLQEQFRQLKDQEASRIKIKREQQAEHPTPRKRARISARSTLLEFDEEGRVVESAVPAGAGEETEHEIVELD